jgi:hypothetical protein
MSWYLVCEREREISFFVKSIFCSEHNWFINRIYKFKTLILHFGIQKKLIKQTSRPKTVFLINSIYLSIFSNNNSYIKSLEALINDYLNNICLCLRIIFDNKHVLYNLFFFPLNVIKISYAKIHLNKFRFRKTKWLLSYIERESVYNISILIISILLYILLVISDWEITKIDRWPK